MPSVLFAAQLSMQAPHSLSILPMFPTVITVNGLPLSFDAPARLLVGDTIGLHTSVSSPPCAQYVYLKEDVPGLSSNQQQHESTPTAVATVPVVETGGTVRPTRAASRNVATGVGGGVITLRSFEAPLEHRGTTFAHYNPRNQDRLFRDL
eukprot:TRINITY_DN11378_c0_g1_i1.p1 TRINITY_DN11378_c0_g1~~TRINITY_DN11378_c0_g1_i1.p1  ORF type:complete len:161 (-),score=7.37 TRINITY_DN11378_c0_g1_i1:3-452(-)